MGPAGTETGPTKTLSHHGCGTCRVGPASVPAFGRSGVVIQQAVLVE